MIKKITAFVVNARIPIVIVVLILAGICGYLSTKVSVNYNFTKYLPEDTDTVKALEVMEREFGMTGTSEVMVRNITLSEAKELQGELANVEYIKTVNFFNTPIYFLDEDGDGVGDAVFKLFFDGDDYSAESQSAILGIEEVLKGRDIAFNGAAEHNASLKHRLQSQVVLATVASILIVALILILTSKSWMEPLIIGATLGVAIIMNMGTNYFLGEISFVTKSIAAILQIALTIDYSIMLLHQYREELSYGYDDKTAMKNALVNALSPISSSALTTVTGLAAIMFMSFALGFDIGLILSKAIVCSMLSVFFIMPSLTVIFAKQIKKSEHKNIIKEPNRKNTRYSKVVNKFKKPIVIIFALLLIGSYFVQAGANFVYLETEKDMVGKKNAVEERFGYSNLVMVLTPKAETDEDFAKQEALIEWLKTLTNGEGNPAYRDALSTVTTTRRLVDAADGAALLGMDKGLVEQLFGMYYLEKGVSDGTEMSAREFVEYLSEIASGERELPFGFDLGEVFGGDISGVLNGLLGFLDDGINADTLYAFLNGDEIKSLVDLSGLSKDYINQVFGMYYYHNETMNPKVFLYEIITYLDGEIKSGNGIDFGAFLEEDEKTAVSAFAKLLRALKDDTKLQAEDFYGILTDAEVASLGISLDIDIGYIKHIYAYHNLENPLDYKISVKDLIGYFADVIRGGAASTIGFAELIGGGEPLEYVLIADEIMKIMPESYTPQELLDALKGGGFDDALGVSFAEIPKGYIDQIYGMYYYRQELLGDAAKISMRDIVRYLADATTENGDGSRKAYSNIDLLPILGDGAEVLQAVAYLFDLLDTSLSSSDFFDALNGGAFAGFLEEGLIEQGYIDHVYAYYHFSKDYKITPEDFIKYLCGVLKGDPNYKATVDFLEMDLGADLSELASYAELLEKVVGMRGKSYEPKALEAFIKGELYGINGNIDEIIDLIDIAYINQIYGMYYYSKDRMEKGGYDKLNAKQILEFLNDLASGAEEFPIDVGAILGENADFLKAAVKLTDILEGQYTYSGLYNELLSDEIKNVVDITDLDGKGTGLSADYFRLLYAWKKYKKDGMSVGTKTYQKVLTPLFEVAAVAGINLSEGEKLGIRSVVLLTGGNPFTEYDAAGAGAFFAGSAGIIQYFNTDETFEITPEMIKEIVEIAYAWDAFKSQTNTFYSVKDLFQFIADDVVNPNGVAYLDIVGGMLDESTISLLNAVVKLPDDLKTDRSYSEMAAAIDGYAEKFGMIETGAKLIPASLMKQAYILYWGSKDFCNMNSTAGAKSVGMIELLNYLADVVNPDKPNNEYFDEFIYGDILIPLLSEFGREDAMTDEQAEENAKALIAVIVDAADALDYLDKNFSKAAAYEEAAAKIDEYTAKMFPNTEFLGADIIGALLEQAYIMYYYNADTAAAAAPVLLKDMAEFIIDRFGDNALIAAVFGDDAEVISGLLKLAKDIYGEIEEPLEYRETAAKLTGYLEALDMDLGLGLDLDEEIIRQAYIMYFSAKDYAGIPSFERSANISHLVGYIAGLLYKDETNTDYSGFFYDIILGVLEGETDYETADIEKIIAAASSAVSELAANAETEYGYIDLAGILNGVLSELDFLDYTIDESLIKQAFVMYFYNADPSKAEEGISFINVVRYIIALTDVKDLFHYDATIAGFLGEDLKDILTFAEEVREESGEELTYKEAGNLIKGYLNRLSGADAANANGLTGSVEENEENAVDYEKLMLQAYILAANANAADAVEENAVDYEELMLQAYILYVGSKGEIPTAFVEVSHLLNYLVSIIDPTNEYYNNLVGGLIDGLLDGAPIVGLGKEVCGFVGGIDRKTTYLDLAAAVNSIAVGFGEIAGAEIDGFSPRLFEQLFIFKMSEDGTMPTDKVTVANLVDFLYEIIDDEFISGFLDERTRADMDAYRETLATAETMFNGTAYSRMVFTFNIPTSGDEAFDFVDGLREKSVEIFGEEVRVAGTTVVLKDIRNNFEMDTFVISLASILSVFLVIALIYKSFMIPMILVLLIQAATWIAFSVSTLLGEPVYFMAYTVVSCIQMGAAIDYGILMSSKYLRNRKFMNKRDAVSCAVKESLNTILTSGSILVIAGLVLYVISSTMVLSSIGMYIFRGVLTSILMTIFVLPALLLVFDKWIEKTTRKADFYKGEKTIDGGDYILDAEGGIAVSLENQSADGFVDYRAQTPKSQEEGTATVYKAKTPKNQAEETAAYRYRAQTPSERRNEAFNGGFDFQSFETTRKSFDVETARKPFSGFDANAETTSGTDAETTRKQFNGFDADAETTSEADAQRFETPSEADAQNAENLKSELNYDEIFNPYYKENK
jgi:predicted RND superfamily exporter protein